MCFTASSLAEPFRSHFGEFLVWFRVASKWLLLEASWLLNTLHKQKVSHFYFESFQKAEFRMYLVCFHTFTYKIQISTISEKAWAACDYTFHVKVFKFYYQSPSFFPVPLLLSIFFVNWNLEILPVPDPDLELRGREGRRAVIQTFTKGGRASLQKKKCFSALRARGSATEYFPDI